MTRIVVAAALAGAAFLSAITALPRPAAAQAAQACPLDKAAGLWTIGTKSRAGILKIAVVSRCGALIAVAPGGAVPQMPSDFEVEVFGDCPEKECTWGKVPARLEGRDRIVLRVDQGFAVRTITLTLSGDRLQARTWTDYVDTRSDFATTDTLSRLKRS